MQQDNLLVTDRAISDVRRKAQWQLKRGGGGGWGFPVKHIRLSTGTDYHFLLKPYLHKVIRD